MEKESSQINITSGSLKTNILKFCIPVIGSQILQVLFNMSDVAVVGRFAGHSALGSVGSSGLAIFLFLGFIIGMGNGVNAVAAVFMGSGNVKKLKKMVSTSFLVCLIYGTLMFILAFISTKGLLSLLKTKEDLMDQAIKYMQIFLIGFPGIAVYNFGSGILSAAGDSKRPLIYIAISGIANVILNLIFVIYFKLAAVGVAIASAISQYLAAVFVMHRLLTCNEDYKLSLTDLKIDIGIAKRIFSIGMGSGLQNAVFSIANLFIQASVNSFDSITVAANTAAANIDSIVFRTLDGTYLAATTFVGQNLGAGKMDRVNKSFKICLVYGVCAAAVYALIFCLFGRSVLRIFTTEDAVIEIAMIRVIIMTLSLLLAPLMDCPIAAMRGFGETLVPMLIVIAGSCIFRIVWVFTIFNHFRTLESLYLVYAFSWIITAIFELLYYRKVYNSYKLVNQTDIY